jgi:uncharacterized protein YbjT (DUF2867 family)
MILLTGAGGKTGRGLIKALSNLESVCALVRREDYAAIVSALGAEKVIVADMSERDAVRSAMQGARSVYHICPNMSPDEAAIGNLVVDEARKAKVEHFVYHSVLHPQTEKMHHHWQKLRVEEALFESGLPFTVLQPAPYMQNLLTSWKTIMEQGMLRVPYSVDARFSFVDLEDVAEAAKIVLTKPKHLNATYELAGTAPVSHIEVAEMLGRVLNREVRAEREDVAEWKKRSQGLSDYAAENLVAMFDYYDRCGLAGNTNVLTWLLGREPTSVESFLQRTVKERDVLL